jgi:hypothetical protein
MEDDPRIDQPAVQVAALDRGQHDPRAAQNLADVARQLRQRRRDRAA